MEIWDGYREDGTLAGVDLIRGEVIPEGVYHLVCDVLVRHEDGDFLLMQRSFSKPNYGGKYEATAGGSALKGEGPEQCACRELTEETGIDAGRLIPIGVQCDKQHTIYHDFLCVTGCDKASVLLQEGETIAYKWVDEAGFKAYLDSDEAIPKQTRRRAAFYHEMGYTE